MKSTRRPVDEIGEYLHLTMKYGGHFRFYDIQNSATIYEEA